jgi:mRNA-degrading endonuclease toxin of MazEF toxin-antitoxin module
MYDAVDRREPPSRGVSRGIAGNREECEVMVDQSRAIDNRRLTRSLKPLPRSLLAEVVEKLRRLGEL